MIKASELRLDNYINHKDLGIVKVISISSKIGDYESVFVECLEDGIDYNFNLDKDLAPIPLTEEMLLKCGFRYERAISSFTHEKMDMWLSLDYESEEFIMYPTDKQRLERQERLMNKFRNGEGLIPTAEAEYRMSDVRIKHLHQLQNLYFTLAGEELNISI